MSRMAFEPHLKIAVVSPIGDSTLSTITSMGQFEPVRSQQTAVLTLTFSLALLDNARIAQVWPSKPNMML